MCRKCDRKRESKRISLPNELVNEILTRLPAKSLMRFKSVERSWNTLFKTNSFIRRQKEIQMGSTSPDEYCFIMFYTETESNEPKITILSTRDLPEYESLEFPISHPNHYLEDLSAMNQLNGIYHVEACFSPNSTDESDIKENIIWNPTTREVKVIHPNPLAPPTNLFSVYSGFGASDPHTFDQFKYIQIYTINTTVVYAELYDLNTNSRFVILDIHDSHVNVHVKSSLEEPGAYCNGVYHWLYVDSTYILCFDFHCNKFRTIKTPLTKVYGQIIEANNCIAYLVYDEADNEVDYTGDNWDEIWNLKQDGSWVKQGNIAPLPEGNMVCAILKDGTEFLGEPEYDYMPWYNSRGQILRQFYITTQSHLFRAYHYV